MNFYRKVSKKTFSNGKGPANMQVFNARAKELKENKLKEEQEKIVIEQSVIKNKKELASRLSAKNISLEGYKTLVINKLYTYTPLLVMNEFFSRVMVNALPHDEEWVTENLSTIVSANKIYLHHLGGMKYLKEQAKKTNSYFLNQFYHMVKENSDQILASKIQDIKNASSEEEIRGIIKNGITTEKIEKLNKDISDLNPDEISKLVQKKVIDVVKDESKRQAEDGAFRAELEQRAQEFEKENEDELNPGITDGETDDDGEEIESSNTEEAPVDPDTTKESSIAKYLLDPTVLHENTLFYSMVQASYYTMMHAMQESSEPELPKQTSSNATSPLNLNLFDVYLNDYQDDLKNVDNLVIASKQPLAGSETTLDSEDVLAEALTQFTLLETANTMKLISFTSEDVKEMIKYNLAIR